MKKEKKTPTRRRIALRRTAAALVMLPAMWLLNGGSILPTGVLRAQADSNGMGPVELVKALGRLPMKGRYRRVYLSANQDAVLLSTADFYLMMGWRNDGGAAVDCAGQGPVHIGQWTVSDRAPEGEQGYIYFFGRVDDPGIREVGVMCGARDEAGELTIHGFEGSQLTSSREEWVRWGGYDYFVMSAPLDVEKRWTTLGDYYLCVDGYMVQPDVRVSQWTSTSLGD